MYRSLALTIPLYVLTWLAQPVVAADPKKTPTDKDRERLQGVWVLTAYTVDGMRAPDNVLKNAVLNFRDGKFVLKPMPVPSIDVKTGETTWEAKRDFEAQFELGNSGKFKTIDLIVGKGTKALPLKGIYTLDGDELRICFSFEEKPPTEFQSKTGSKNRLFVVKRVKR